MSTALVASLQRLDRLGIDVWLNRGGWFWASRLELQAWAPQALGDLPRQSPVRGPFGSMASAVDEACNQALEACM